MKKILTLTAVLILCSFTPVLFTGCKTKTPQTIAYNTLYSVEKVTVGAYDAYADQIIKGNVSTNGLPQVSSKYNHFQLAYLIALDGVQWNTNAIAPNALIVESNDIINLINSFTKK
jgi:hypothetical protein